MFAALAHPWTRPDEAQAATQPRRRRSRAPVLMGDILIARCGDPELLIRWREDRDADSGD